MTSSYISANIYPLGFLMQLNIPGKKSIRVGAMIYAEKVDQYSVAFMTTNGKRPYIYIYIY